MNAPTTPAKRGTQKGSTFTDEHKKNLSEAHKNSPAAKRHRRRLAVSLEGISPNGLAIARSLATRKLKAMGLTREGAPELYVHYTEFYRRRRAERGKS